MQERIGHVRNACRGLGRIGEHGLAADVAGGRDERTAELAEQQLVQRAVRQEDADLAQTGRHLRREVEPRTGPQQHDRSRRVEQRCTRCGFQVEAGLDRVQPCPGRATDT